VARTRRFLQARGLWDDDQQQQAERQTLARIDRAIAEAEQVSVPPFQP
jgi:TPP-dependent pyruvate/acetoin dehydrogenase alpha subunit